MRLFKKELMGTSFFSNVPYLIDLTFTARTNVQESLLDYFGANQTKLNAKV